MHDEIEQLRAEIALLRKDMQHVLRLMDQERSEDGTRPQYPILEAQKFTARSSDHSLPLIVHAVDDRVEIRLNDKDMRPRVLLSVDESGACLEFRNAHKATSSPNSQRLPMAAASSASAMPMAILAQACESPNTEDS